MREKDVRFQVSAARSAAKDCGVISTAVRQTPLTAMLSPFVSSFSSCSQRHVRRPLPFFCAMRGDASDFFDDASKHGEYSVAPAYCEALGQQIIVGRSADVSADS